MSTQTFFNISLAIVLALAIIVILFGFGLLRPLGALSLGLLVVFIALGAVYTIFRLNKV